MITPAPDKPPFPTRGMMPDMRRGTARYDHIDLNNAAVQFLSGADFGHESFVFQVTDGHGGSSFGTLYITVTGENDAPVAVDDIFHVTEAGTVNGNATGDTNSPTTSGSTASPGTSGDLNVPSGSPTK